MFSGTNTKKGKQERGMGACVPTFEDVLELVLLQGGPHDLLDGRDVLVQLDHQRVVVHALHVGHDGVVALLGQGNEVMEAMHPGSRMRQSGRGSGTLGRAKVMS